jgi:hypothetical protein
MLFRHPEHGWHHSVEIEAMKKTGWIESSDEEFKAHVAAKNKPKEPVKPEEPENPKAPQKPQKRPGRPPRG